jgi:hypothetical protein
MGHDNSTQHPPVDECLKSIDFMFEYVDQYMKFKPAGLKYVMLNVYGGESLHHPNIVEILTAVHDRYKNYSDRWHLTITTTTNAIVNNRILENIIPLIDEFTVSYHTENSSKQKQQFRDNLITIKNSGRRIKCVVLMHTEKELFDDANDMIDWLKQQEIKCLPRALDDESNQKQNYTPQQVKWFDGLYKDRSHATKSDLVATQDINLSDTGRACCGGRQVCKDQQYKQREFFVLDNKFPDWHCSVNWFFLYVKQVNGEVYVNKDCKMNFDGSVGPIGNLTDTDLIIDKLKNELATNTLPVIQCKKYNCWCGLCAPKAQDAMQFKEIMKKYTKGYTI